LTDELFAEREDFFLDMSVGVSSNALGKSEFARRQHRHRGENLFKTDSNWNIEQDRHGTGIELASNIDGNTPSENFSFQG